MKKYDIVIIGSGPGGYVAAIRASQLGKKVAIVEAENLGGICLNWGCIPTKALLRNAEIFQLIRDSQKYGIQINDYTIDWKKIIKRSRNIAKRLSKGIEYLMKKNKIDVIIGYGVLVDRNTVKVISKESEENIQGSHIIISTGASANWFPGLEPDGKNIITYKEALVIKEKPKHIVIIGAGAIGVEFAYYFNTFGSQVTLIEAKDDILPNEDKDISKELTTIFKRRKMNIKTKTIVEKISKSKKGLKVRIKNEVIDCDKVLIAVGIKPNSDNIGLNDLSINLKDGWIVTNEYMQTNIDNIFAIGDVSGPPWLAHVASAEAIVAIEYIYGHSKRSMNYDNIPACTYCHPQVASVGITEKQAKDKGIEVLIGKFPFRALGKALAIDQTEGFVKIIYDKKYGELLGCHIIGANATDIITEASLARDLETTHQEILHSIHPHPTLSEAIMEATADAMGESINF